MSRTTPRWVPVDVLPRRKLKRLIMFFALVAIVLLLHYVIKPRRKEVPEEIPDRKDFNFSLMLPFIEPKLSPDQRRLFMAVIVNSAAAGRRHRLLRTAIRNTWGDSSSKFEHKHKKSWRLFFLLGLTNFVQDEQANLLEAAKYNDVIVGNFTDHYYNLATKTFMGHYWVISRLSCEYVLKTDDDVYVRVPQTIQWLQGQGSPRRFYGGYVERKKLDVIRDKTDKWYITHEQYDKDKWPPYCHGAFHVLSNDAIPFIINSSRERNPLFTDDAYIAVIMLNASIPATPIPGYWVFRNFKLDCDLVSVKATGHKLTVDALIRYHAFYQTHAEEDIKWRCSYLGYWIYKKVISKYLAVL